MEVNQTVSYHNPKTKQTHPATVKKVGAQRVGIQINGEDVVRWVQRHNVQVREVALVAAAPAAIAILPPAPKDTRSRGTIMFETARSAAKYASIEDFTPVRRGKIMSRRSLLTRDHVYLMVFWGRYSLSLMKDGTLMMVCGETAYEVSVPFKVLESIFEVHREVSWWKARVA